MSVASEITALGTNLAAAKNAVTTKGGTVGDTGLAGLATEIASIPSGGGSVPVGDYGKVAYYSSMTFKVDDIMAMGCNAEVVDAAKLAPFADPRTVELRYSNDVWTIGWEGTDTYTTAELESVVGVRVTNISDSMAEVRIMGELSVDTASDLRECALDTAQDFSLFLFQDDSGKLLPNGDTVKRNQIVSFVVGSSVTTIGDNFLTRCVNLSFLDFHLATNLTSIGDFALYGTEALCQKLDISSVTSIGDNFAGNSGITEVKFQHVQTIGVNFCNYCDCSSLQLPAVTTIGTQFLAYSRGLSSFTLPSTLTTIGTSAFRSCSDLKSLNLGNLYNITSIGANFAYDCSNLTRVDFPSRDLSGCFGQDDTASFAVSTNNSLTYLAGIKAYGSSSDVNPIKAKFPDRTSSPYRKWAN